MSDDNYTVSTVLLVATPLLTSPYQVGLLIKLSPYVPSVAFTFLQEGRETIQRGRYWGLSAAVWGMDGHRGLEMGPLLARW